MRNGSRTTSAEVLNEIEHKGEAAEGQEVRHTPTDLELDPPSIHPPDNTGRSGSDGGSKAIFRGGAPVGRQMSPRRTPRLPSA